MRTKAFYEGMQAYKRFLKPYSYENNPYKGTLGWNARDWQAGYQEAYRVDNPDQFKEVRQETSWSFRSEGENDHIDRYAGRGV